MTSPSGRVARIGLVVNPIAGLGGPVGLKGTDGVGVVERALALGAVPAAGVRAARALASLRAGVPEGSFELLVAPGPMGEEAAQTAGLVPARVVGSVASASTTAEDTRLIAREMTDADLLLFVGGDGTAADVLAAVGGSLAALGVPAGVKIHSGVFAVSPEAAGRVAARLARGARVDVAEAEVLDLDEDAYRRGEIAPRLLGYLRVPREPRLVQSRKAPSPASERVAVEAIAADVVGRMESTISYVLGPGTTVRTIADRLGVPKTLVGVDVVRDGRLLVADAAERDLLAIVEEGPTAIVVTPIGGQGFLLGRGNQQIGPAVVSRVGRANLLVVATPWKLASLGGAPLRVDTGDREVDAMVTGYLQVITGHGERAVVRVEA